MLKAFATGITLGSGGNGGNFAPSLFVGSYLGFFVAKVINSLDHPIYIVAFAMGFATGTVVGITSGVYPARRAASLDPIDALRAE